MHKQSLNSDLTGSPIPSDGIAAPYSDYGCSDVEALLRTRKKPDQQDKIAGVQRLMTIKRKLLHALSVCAGPLEHARDSEADENKRMMLRQAHKVVTSIVAEQEKLDPAHTLRFGTLLQNDPKQASTEWESLKQEVEESLVVLKETGEPLLFLNKARFKPLLKPFEIYLKSPKELQPVEQVNTATLNLDEKRVSRILQESGFDSNKCEIQGFEKIPLGIILIPVLDKSGNAVVAGNVQIFVELVQKTGSAENQEEQQKTAIFTIPSDLISALKLEGKPLMATRAGKNGDGKTLKAAEINRVAGPIRHRARL